MLDGNGVDLAVPHQRTEKGALQGSRLASPSRGEKFQVVGATI